MSSHSPVSSTPVWPVILKLGPLTIYSYGTMMAIAFLVAGWLTGREMDRRGLPGEVASTMVFWAAVGGIGGSKLWAILQDWRDLLHDPIGMIFSGSGFVWYGGLIGGTLAVTWTIRKHGLRWLPVVDCAAAPLVLAHGIGRIGCQLAGDGDWGTVTTLPWGMAYPKAIVGWQYPPGVVVHPTPIYEMLAYFAIFAVLWKARTRPHADGALFWWYLVLAPAARFVIEFWRINPPVAFGLSAAQLTSLGLIAVGVVGLLVTRRAPAAAGTGQLAHSTRR
jgi:phosphatidylglycerol---prolipoprotein diacylglyceryl transferase